MDSIIPFWGDKTTRKRIDELFSRKMLGSVLVGKFVGDYAAILMVRSLGVDTGYGAGIAITIVTFVYWEKLEGAADDAKEKVSEAVEEE